MEDKNKPVVSICCLTYNHAPFIRKCLDGFLMQETSFPIEILIHDDASTDGTDKIIREYETKYPDIIFPVFEAENQYSKPGHQHMDLYNYTRAKGKYIAYCEGDDYWTDPLKLQKQVEFMETHPEYSVCWHRFYILYADSKELTSDSCGELFHNSDAPGVDIDVRTCFSGWYTQPLTMVFRRSMYDFGWIGKYKHYKDDHEVYHLLSEGKGHLLNFNGGVYVIHGGGIFGSLDNQKQSEISCDVAEELYNNNKNEYTKEYYYRTLRWAWEQHQNCPYMKLLYSWRMLLLNRNFRSFAKRLFH